MSTKVFPKTDSVATVSSWADMASAIDRGSTDPLSGVSDLLKDTSRLVWVSNNNATVDHIDTTNRSIATIPIDIGTCWIGAANIAVERINNGGTGPMDNFHLRLDVPAGILVYVAVESVANFSSLIGGSLSGNNITGQAADIHTVYASAPWTDEQVINILIVAMGVSSSGDIGLFARKGSNLDVDDYRTKKVRILLNRIVG